MSNLDMAEAVRILAADKGISVETLLQVLADALVAAYKRRPDAADEAEVHIDADTMDIRIIAYDQIDRAKTVFEWGPAPKPGSGPKRKKEHSS